MSEKPNGNTDPKNGDEEIDLDDLNPDKKGDEDDKNKGEEGDDAEALKKSNEQLKENNRKLFARAKKAEGWTQDKDGNWVKTEKKADPKPKSEEKPAGDDNNRDQSDPSVTSFVSRLAAKDVPDDEIEDRLEQARKIARVEGIPLKDAFKDPLFIAYSKERDEQLKKDAAKLGGSKGSGQEKKARTFDTGLGAEGRDKHKDAWKDRMGAQ